MSLLLNAFETGPIRSKRLTSAAPRSERIQVFNNISAQELC